MVMNDFLAHLEVKTGYKPKPSGKGYSARCPCSTHADKKASLSLTHSENGKILIHCHAGCSYESICQELGFSPSLLFDKLTTCPSSEYYYYYDEKINVLYRKVKTPSKEFYFEKFQNEQWVRGLEGVRRVLYNLPEVQSAICENKIIAVVEGEKDAETLRKYGYVATTIDTGGGKSKWKQHHSEMLKNAHVLLFFDYDKTGIEHRDNIIAQMKGHVASLKLVNLPGYEVVPKNGKDISDWLKEGHTSSDLKKLVEEAVIIIEPSII